LAIADPEIHYSEHKTLVVDKQQALEAVLVAEVKVEEGSADGIAASGGETKSIVGEEQGGACGICHEKGHKGKTCPWAKILGER